MKSRPRRSPQGLTRQDVFSVLGALGAILTLVTAVMFYFGWRRADVQARAMHIEVSLFGFSTQDYVLRSISSLTLPLILVMGLCLAWVWLHSHVLRLLGSGLLTTREHRAVALVWSRGVAVTAIALAVGCLLFWVATGFPDPPGIVNRLKERLQNIQWVVPLVLIVSTLTAAYAIWIRRHLQLRHESRHGWGVLLSPVLVAGVVVVGTFWMLEEYATLVGRGHARQLVRDVRLLPSTVVISPAPLGIRAPGVREERLGAADSPETRYRTTGLRLLARSGGKVLLVHDGWTPRNGTVIVLPDSDELGWQFSR